VPLTKWKELSRPLTKYVQNILTVYRRKGRKKEGGKNKSRKETEVMWPISQ
jgi:hypothetical protein